MEPHKEHEIKTVRMDETTDITTKKSLMVILQFFDEERNEVTDCFFGLLEVTESTAEAVFAAICNHLQEHNINLEKLLGFAADNATVTMGNSGSLKAKFEQLLPNIFIIGCIYHSFHLYASAAANKLAKSTEDFVRSVYNYFCHSSKHYNDLKEFQKFCDTKPYKLLRPSQTPWLSLQ
ncbi:hypothetical protein ILUMI_16085, partial [Ignelater luminosus]